MKKIFVYLSISLLPVLLLSSCNSSDQDKTSVVLSHDDTLTGIILPEYVRSEFPKNIFYTPYGIICAPETEQGVIQLLDTTDGHAIYSRVKNGKGPEELITSLGQGFNNQTNEFCVLDIGKNQINNYRVSDTGLMLRSYIKYKQIYAHSVRSISDSSTAILTSTPDQSVVIINEEGVVIEQLPYRLFKEPGLNYARYFEPSVIDVSRKNKVIVVAANHLPSLTAYSYENGKLALLWSKMIFKPYYTFKNNWRWIIPDKNRGGFEQMVVSDNYIYVTYYGIKSEDWEKQIYRNFEEITLLVFNLQGTLVRTILLDKNVSTFTVSPDDRVLYGMIEKPDRLIVKYNLKI